MTTPRVPGYRDFVLLKHGGSADLYRAVREADGDTVAVKMLRKAVWRDPEATLAFRREAKILKGLACRSIVAVHDLVWRARPRPAMVLEYFPSDNLKWWLCVDSNHPRRYWHAILYEVAGALMYIHDRGIIHRDVKPENILVSETGQAKLADFSLAETAVREPRTIAGTPTYISPEAITRAPITHLSDVYSLGVTAYELLCGRPPFLGHNTEDVLEQHLRAQPRSLPDLAPTVPTCLCQLVMRMLAKEPPHRPQNLREVLTVLRETPPDPLPSYEAICP